MGGNVLDLLKEDTDAVAVCGVDLYPREIGIPVYTSFADIQEEADVIIDFSSPTGLKERLDYAKEKGLGIVLAATGFSEEDLALVKAYSQYLPIFKTANLSVGINVMQLLVELAAKRLEGYDVEILEKHHNLKKDAPSGTALMLAETLKAAYDDEKYFVNGREGMVGKREKEIGVMALRGGTVAGIHEVKFFGDNETIEIKHIANNRQIFVNGAIKAAEFVVNQPAGLYNMDSMM
jgi:4-hydroxy-tetrahydrodipicolinate reductase